MKYELNYIQIIIFASILSFSTGCSIRDSFQPLPPMFKNWEKIDSSPEEVKRALLKCGYDNPYNGFDPQVKITINTLAKSSKCMRDNRFNYKLSNGKAICDFTEWENLPACQ